MTRHLLIVLAAGACLYAGLGCGAGGASESGGASYGAPDTAGGGGGGGGFTLEDDAGSPRPDVPLPPPPPEEEQEFQPPSVGDRYVFVLHPSREQVIEIDAVTLDISLSEVGLRPTVLSTAPGRDVAVVINAGGGDLSVIHAAPTGSTVRNVSTTLGVNRLAVSSDGRHAVAFFDFEALEPGEPVGSLQSVTVVRLVEGQVAAVEVGTGFHPEGVTFAADGEDAYVVTEEGVTRIPLSGELPAIGVLPTVPVSLDPLADALEREVLVTPDGAYAVVRTLGQASLSIVDLATGGITDFPLPGEPTDVDLTPDGTRVLVMMRREALAALGGIEEMLADPAALVPIDLGAMPLGAAVVSPTGDHALLYTTIDELEALVRLDLDSLEQTPVLLQKTVRAVSFGPVGARALVLHRRSGATPSSSMDLEDFVDASHAYSVVDVGVGIARLQLTDDAPGAFAFTEGGERLYVLLPGSSGAAGHSVADVDLATLMTQHRPLASPPEAVQPVPAAGKVAVSQEHPTGRITFFDIADGESDTLTGFELGGLID